VVSPVAIVKESPSIRECVSVCKRMCVCECVCSPGDNMEETTETLQETKKSKVRGKMKPIGNTVLVTPVERKPKGKAGPSTATRPPTKRGRNYQDEKHTDILSFNAGAEEAFLRGVKKMIRNNEGKPVEVGRVIQKAAFKLQISTMTAKRYLTKHSDDEAELCIRGKLISLNPDFVEGGDDDWL